MGGECNIMYCTSLYCRIVRYHAVRCLLAGVAVVAVDGCSVSYRRASRVVWSGLV